MCQSCEQLWKQADEQGFYHVDVSAMSAVAKRYETGLRSVLWRLPEFTKLVDEFENKIQYLKDQFQGTDEALEADWPGLSFKDLVKSLLVDSGVTFEGTGRARNPFMRSRQPSMQKRRPILRLGCIPLNMLSHTGASKTSVK